MKRFSVVPIAVLLAFGTALPAHADHLNTDIEVPSALPADVPVFNEGGIRFIANLPVSNGLAAPLGENGPFERDGRRYFATGSSRYGLQVVDVTDPFNPTLVSTYSATFGCEAAVAEAYAQGNFDPLTASQAYENDPSFRPDGTIAVLGMDSGGRCHDPVMGGVEIIDLHDVTKPRTLHLTRTVGESHSITIDPVRPWLAWVSSSDGADFIEIIDFRSCLGGVENKDKCRPVIARAVFNPLFMKGVPLNPEVKGADLATSGCHDIRIVGDLLYCGAVGQSSILDISKVLDDEGNLTGTHLTEGEFACPLVDAVRTVAKVTDCSSWTEDAFIERKAKGANVEMLSLIDHDGSKPASEDIDISHQAEPTSDGRIMFITDERGGGLANFDGCPGGGLHFYDIRDKRNPVLMQFPDGAPAIYRTAVNLPAEGVPHMSCTIHYGQQFGKENILTFGWYLNGTRVIRFEPDYTTSPATIKIEEVGAYLATGGYTIQAKPLMRNPDNPEELLIYTSDATRGIDVLGIDLEKILLSAVSTFPAAKVNKPDVKVLGNRQLANTGLWDPMTIGLVLVMIAAFIVRRLQAVR